MWALQAHGARVAVCQRSVARRRLAAELGADCVLGPDGDPTVVLGEPPKAAVVTAPGSEALGWALERVDTGGRVHAFAGSSLPSEIDANVIHYRHLTLVGSTGSGLPDYHRARSLVLEGTVRLSRLPRTVISLDEAAVALRTPEVVPFHKTIVAIGRSAAA
jgi:L-iditol 2-dehydrogenase